MNHVNRRVSRILIAILCVALCSGAAVALHGIFRGKPQAQASAAPETPAISNHEISRIATSDPIQPPSPSTRPASAATAITAAAQQSPSTQPAYLTGGSVVNAIADAKAKQDTGKLVEARAQLNALLQSGGLTDADAKQLKSAIAQINQTLVFSPTRFADDPYEETYTVQEGWQKQAAAHDLTWDFICRTDGVSTRKLRLGQKLKLINGPFCAVVDKTRFTMDIYLGGFPGEKHSMFVTEYQVGLGKDDSTPTGTWMVESGHKLKSPTYYSPRGEGVIPANDPKNPLGGFWIGLTGTDGKAVGQASYGIHGTNEPDSIGKQSSMGCIRMPNQDIPVVYDILVEGKSLVMVKE